MVNRELLVDALAAIRADELFRHVHRDKLLIVMYHGIVDDAFGDHCWSQLPYRQFAAQIEYLRSRHTVVALDEAVRCLRSGKPLPERPAVITFDDGLKNNRTRAFPLLERLQLPFTIFLTTDYIGTDVYLWFDRLFIALLGTANTSLDATRWGLGEWVLDDQSSRMQCFEHVVRALKTRPPGDYLPAVEGIEQSLGTVKSRADEFSLLGLEDIEAMKRSGLATFGAHTATHAILSRLSQEDQRVEIERSCDWVREVTGRKEICFAYPNGGPADFTEHSVRILEECRVLCAVTTLGGLNAPTEDRYRLKRVSVSAWLSQSGFRLRCSGLYEALRNAVGSKGDARSWYSNETY